ncbi:MAG TPA: ABC transporter permease [Gemmatimonadaceae bacterium]|jgi:predicted permease
MSIVTSVRMWLRALFRRDRVERDMSKEMQFHLARETELNIRRGLPLEEARRAALVAFGGVEQMKEATRDMRGLDRLESIVRDLRYAIRSLQSRPAFTLTVIATLALGIGANTAIFTLVDALMLRPLAVPHPEQLVIVSDPAVTSSSNNVGDPVTDYVSFPLYRDVRAGNAVFSDMYASGATNEIDVQIGAGADATTEASAEQPHARFVTGNFFSVLGVSAYAGRTFSADEDEAPGQDPVAVLTYEYWQRRFSGSRAAIGSIMRVNDVPLTIVGVTPPSFHGDNVGQPLDFWMPMMMYPIVQPRMPRINGRDWSWVVMMGRLKPGMTLEQARHEVPVVEASAIREHLSSIGLARFEQNLKSNPIHVVSGARGFSERRAEYGKALWVLMAAVGLVILVVCANVSSLMLARIAARRREMTVRLTLGASRGRLIQQTLVEGTLLAIVSSVVGLFAATWGSRALLATVSASSPIAIDTTPDARVLAFTATLALGCVVMFGLLPAFRATQVDLATSLRTQGRNLMGAARVGSIPFGRALVVAQIALSMLLLIGGGLLVRSMQQLLHGDLGVDRDHVVAVRVRMSRSRYIGPRLAQFRRDLADRVGRLPGVDAVAFADHGLFSGGTSNYYVDISGFIPQADSERQVSLDRVGPNFFHAIGARLIRGRDIEPSDLETGPPATVINETMAKRYFAARNPLGATVTMGSVQYTIVGVVRDFQSSDVRGQPRREMYPVFSNPNDGNAGQAKLAVHVRGDPSRFVGAIEHAIEDVDRTLPGAVRPVNDLVRDTVSEDVLLVQVTTFFCVVTLVLAALGLYGVTAYSTSQRTSEFGLRAALGAQPSEVTRMVLGEAVRVAIIGVLIGVPAGLAATRLIRAQLFGVGTIDVPSLSVAIMVLVATAIVASYLPARRAAKVGPLEALRLE